MCHEQTVELSKYSRTIHRRKGDTDERSLSEKCASAIESAGDEPAHENPKPHRVKDLFAIEWVKKWGKCQHCGKTKARSSDKTLHVHHIKTRGAFGGDVPENLVLLCFQCHTGTHQAGLIPRDELIRLALDRMRLMPMPKRETK